ncbi:pyruvate kinase [Enterococcus sp. LJL90]
MVTTQIKDFIEHDPIPTRTEVSDAINALLNKSQALLLSGKTTIGQYLVETIQMLRDIINYNIVFEI